MPWYALILEYKSWVFDFQYQFWKCSFRVFPYRAYLSHKTDSPNLTESVYLISLVVTIPWKATSVYRGYFPAICRLSLYNFWFLIFIYGTIAETAEGLEILLFVSSNFFGEFLILNEKLRTPNLSNDFWRSTIESNTKTPLAFARPTNRCSFFHLHNFFANLWLHAIKNGC